MLEPHRFAEVISLRRAMPWPATLPAHLNITETLRRMSGELDRYTGWYCCYFYAFGYPGQTTRSLAVLDGRDGRHLRKKIETGIEPDLARAGSLGNMRGWRSIWGIAFILSNMKS